MARVVFQAAGTLAETASSATLGIVAPTTLPGDLMIALYHANDNLVVTLPSGWTSFGQNNNTTAQTVLVAWKMAGTSDSGATFNFVKSSNNSLLSCGAIITYRNAKIGYPFDSAGCTYNNNVVGDNTVFTAYTTHAFARANYVMFYGLGATTPNSPTGTNVDGGTYSTRLDSEATLGITATIAVMQGTLTIPGALGVGTMASSSTVDAISVGALFSVISDDDTQAGFSGPNYGVNAGAGGGRGKRPLGPWNKDQEPQ